MSDLEVIAKGIHLAMPVEVMSDGSCRGANLLSDLQLTYVLLPVCGFNGWVMPYEGSYWPALWDWLFGDLGDES